MYRIRFHGRGGQGMKTSSRILGTAFFIEGYEVQDAPKYGAERRGAPMSAYVRAGKKVIYERGVIHSPDLVVVADENLLAALPGIIIDGLTPQSIILVNSSGNIDEWKEKYNIDAGIAYLPVKPDLKQNEITHHLISTVCAASAAGITGVISWKSLETAIRDEHTTLTETAMKENIEAALFAFETIQSYPVTIKETFDSGVHIFSDPGWIEMTCERSGLSAPAVHNNGNSVQNTTGSWSSIHPLIIEEICSRCSLCSVYCPDNAIHLNKDQFPEIDYNHCKGCMICVSVCPKNAIASNNSISSFKRSHYRGVI